MTIHASGSSISATQILAEINKTPSTGVWLSNETALRQLAKKPSGVVKFSDFYSKSSFDAFLNNATALPSTFSSSGADTMQFVFAYASGDDVGDLDYCLFAQSGTYLREENYFFIDPSFTALRAVSTDPEIKLTLLSGPTGAVSGTPTVSFTYNGSPATYGTSYNVSFGILQFLLTTTGCTGTISCSLQVSLNWAGNAATEVTRTITLTRSA